MADAKDEIKAQPEQVEPLEQPTAAAESSVAADAAEPQDEAALVEQLQGELEKAQAAMAEAENQVLRAKADAQNMRRRAEQDVEKARKFALERFSEELLPVADSLERTIEASPADDAAVTALREGVEMTLNMFMATLKKFNVEQLDPQGEPFDPQLHQAMSMVENADVEPNTVLHVMQKGYRLNGRLVRPAMVIVSKAAQPAQPTPKIDEQA